MPGTASNARDKDWGIAAALRVSERLVERLRRAWREDGETGVLSNGLPGRPRLSEAEIARLERELECGLLAHGWVDHHLRLVKTGGPSRGQVSTPTVRGPVPSRWRAQRRASSSRPFRGLPTPRARDGLRTAHARACRSVYAAAQPDPRAERSPPRVIHSAAASSCFFAPLRAPMMSGSHAQKSDCCSALDAPSAPGAPPWVSRASS